jgi:hypothetical protein
MGKPTDLFRQRVRARVEGIDWRSPDELAAEFERMQAASQAALEAQKEAQRLEAIRLDGLPRLVIGEPPPGAELEPEDPIGEPSAGAGQPNPALEKRPRGRPSGSGMITAADTEIAAIVDLWGMTPSLCSKSTLIAFANDKKAQTRADDLVDVFTAAIITAWALETPK